MTGGNLNYFALCLFLHFSLSNFITGDTTGDTLGKRWRYVAFSWAQEGVSVYETVLCMEWWRLFGVSVAFGVFGEQIYPAVPATLLARPDLFISFVFLRD